MSPSTRATRSTCDTSDSTSLRQVEGPQALTDCFGVCVSVNFRRRSVQSCPHVLVCWPLLGWRGVMLRCLSGVSFLCWCLMFLASSCALGPCISHALDAGVRHHRALPREEALSRGVSCPSGLYDRSSSMLDAVIVLGTWFFSNWISAHHLSPRHDVTFMFMSKVRTFSVRPTFDRESTLPPRHQ